jgi:hypothetical protein
MDITSRTFKREWCDAVDVRFASMLPSEVINSQTDFGFGDEGLGLKV